MNGMLFDSVIKAVKDLF